MNFTLLTLFPDMFAGPFNYSIIHRAQQQGIITIDLINIRDFAKDAYKTVDDHPYGGGRGMIMRVDVIDSALEHISQSTKKTIKILLDPRGKPYTQKIARTLATYDHIVMICGHYEGVDERIGSLVDESISIGPYVMTGGELAAMVIVDSVTRLLPGVLPEDATINESFTDNTLEYPQYTRPRVYKGMTVPDILLSGDHKKIEEWRKKHTKNLLQ
ncbi:MAG: tRNA (guanosine(37)-N1)-methyltransferase TrmD [Patescibacteria group bacterium]|nr:tRNA (guanosine(37)-N1)-methyltransferase TrmD [Patescibacteria group bacterium]